MATITITTASIRESKSVLSKVYAEDRSATYTNGRKSVSGSSLTASIEGNEVVITSGYYSEASLREMFIL